MIRSLTSLALVLVAASVPAAQAAPAAAGQPIDVLVIGDSYSAGNGASGTTYGPAGCYRNSTHWGERYAAGLRDKGYAVTLTNHACSGGRTPDVHTPRPMDTQSNRTTPAPAGVTTTAQADAHLAATDPCNAGTFPAEEFWTYRATSVLAGTIVYDCTRTLRPQADFVTPETDLVVFTMGGNDAGFSTIVQGCFVVATRTADACRTSVDAARALIPAIKQRLIDDVAALRAHGLRSDAKIVQLGYPFLQVDNGFSLLDLPTPYPAGDEVRRLITDATAQLATVPAVVNASNPGLMTFVDGVTAKFAGHEPDAQTTNPQTWIKEALSGPDTNVWYHPNDAGQAAYSELLLARGTFGAGGTTATPPAPTATLRVRPTRRAFDAGRPVRLKVAVRLSDGTRPAGRVVVRRAHHRKVLERRRLTVARDGRLRVRVDGLGAGRHVLVVTYRDRTAPRVRDRVRVRLLTRDAR
ncbi:GDSL-type esterase/lipase family protein [Nocardioides zhouii]|uniref:GDSL-type esterase/lipase family protein n=1 Tax=Nocardioides zhouii TaxID=1168729 RepID=UPI0013EE3639|nr:GDSL-type esterase/lipase family protein [Nocardioides zhouii]